ncbi:MAG: transposase [Phycisphaerae bacterium]|nr:transposase [Phycisphaerae bacterium]MDD5381401.1 transposase [Phycisphaerae bacterium]
MIIAYHTIFTTYGTWLPNDPRGSYSKDVYIRQLQSLGTVKYGRQNPQPAKKTLQKFWAVARHCTTRPPFFINDRTRPLVALGFRTVINRFNVIVPACAIMNDHVHILVMRPEYTIEYLVNQLKGAATKAMELDRTPWTRSFWKTFINDADTLSAAARYICANPENSGLPPQSWDFVTQLNV